MDDAKKPEKWGYVSQSDKNEAREERLTKLVDWHAESRLKPYRDGAR